jgi:hypothetical protein
MSIASLSGLPNQQSPGYFSTRRADLAHLGSAIRSGDLAGARQAYQAIIKLGQSGPFQDKEPLLGLGASTISPRSAKPCNPATWPAPGRPSRHFDKRSQNRSWTRPLQWPLLAVQCRAVTLALLLELQPVYP